MTAAYPPPEATAGRDRTTLWGVLGIVVGLLCCGVLGIVFGYLSIRDARRFGNSPVLGWLGIAFGVFNIIGNGLLYVGGNNPFS
ncbi:hypothetical protein [Salinispora mooreana]|uniref:hypothetical protein n=1 Tax=Salinispora mooreana TaxID=999545 RepID=UPI00035FE921|nr:hypothetical protein [Salinispora mooreana]